MDQLTPFYDNTPAERFFTREANQPMLSDGEVNKLMHGLLADVQLQALLDKANTLLQSKLPLVCLQLVLPDQTLVAGKTGGNSNDIEKSFEIGTEQISAKLSYQFASELSIRQWMLLLEMHAVVKRPMQLALDFFVVTQLATRDHLTGLGNRSSYQEMVERHIGASKRSNSSFALLVIDLDKFKQVNDNFGHQEGDKVLLAIGNILKQKMRSTDYAFRLGGDEFCCLITDIEKSRCEQLAKRIKASVEQDSLLSQHNVTCSIGSASYQISDDAASLFGRADAALYKAKQSGRDCYIAA